MNIVICEDDPAQLERVKTTIENYAMMEDNGMRILRTPEKLRGPASGFLPLPQILHRQQKQDPKHRFEGTGRFFG